MYNPSKIKQDAKDTAQALHRPRFTRVGTSFVERIQAKTDVAYRKILRDEIQRLPSIGKTML